MLFFAHGTSTPLGDVAETLAIKSVFGERAYHIPITGTKSQVGIRWGQPGLFRRWRRSKPSKKASFAPRSITTRLILSANLDYVPNEARRHETTLALVNAFVLAAKMLFWP